MKTVPSLWDALVPFQILMLMTQRPIIKIIALMMTVMIGKVSVNMKNIQSLNIFLILCNQLQNHFNLKEDSPSSDDEINVNSYSRNGKH